MNPTEESDSSWTTVGKKRSPNKKAVQPTNTNRKMNIDIKKKPPISKAAQLSVFKKEISIEPIMIGFVVGRKGENLERLKEIYGVTFILPPKGGSLITIEGPSEKMVSAAINDIKDRLSCKTRFFVGKDYISQLIGRNGTIIQALQQALDVNISILREGEVVITGTRCEEAKKAIEENLLVKTSFFIEKDYSILLIGKDGEKIQALEDALEVNIDINRENGQVVITGTRCEEAKEAIEENLSSVTSFFIEKDYHCLVIGPLGETVCALQQAHNVDIHIKEDGEVLIMGKEGEEAKKTIESLIEKTKIANPFKEKFSVTGSKACFVSGKNGSNVKRIESTYNVLLLITPTVKFNPQVLVIGSVAENVSAAKQDILENLAGISLDVDESLVSKIIGPGGETVRRINEEYGVVIEFKEEEQGGKATVKAHILGKKEHTEAAREAIISIISEEFNKKVAAAIPSMKINDSLIAN